MDDYLFFFTVRGESGGSSDSPERRGMRGICSTTARRANRELRRAVDEERPRRGRRGLQRAAECVAGDRRARARAAESKNQLGFISPLVRSARARGVRNSSVALA